MLDESQHKPFCQPGNLTEGDKLVRAIPRFTKVKIHLISLLVKKNKAGTWPLILYKGRHVTVLRAVTASASVCVILTTYIVCI